MNKRPCGFIFVVFMIVMVVTPCFAQFVNTDHSSSGTATSNETPTEVSVIKDAQREAQQAKEDAEVAKKEVEILQKTAELEKKKAQTKFKEAEVAAQEASAIKDSAQTKSEIVRVSKLVAEKEAVAAEALDQARIAQERMLVAQEKTTLAQEELAIAQERAANAEAAIQKQRNTFYRKIIQTFSIILVGYLLIFIIVNIINHRIQEIKVRHIARKNVVYFINFLIIVWVVYVWIHSINSITLFVSVVGAGIALALQEAILCIAGWVLILVRKPFESGDRIELGGVKGDVIDIRLFQTALLEIGNWVDADQSTGRVVNVPNSAIFKKENYNYNRGFEFIWNEIKVLVTFESDWKRGEAIMIAHGKQIAAGMEEVVRREIKNMARRYMIYYEKLTPIVYVNIKDSGIELTLRYLTEARKRRATQDALSRAILDDFTKEEQVDFAYPTYRIVKTE